MRRTLLAALALAPLLAGCAIERVSAAETIRAAGAATQEAGSAEFEMTSSFEGPDGEPVELEGQGRFDFGSQTGELHLALPDGPGVPEDAELVQIIDGYDIYLRSDALGELPDGSTWLHVDLADTTEDQAGVDVTALAGGSNDPTAGLALLRAADDIVDLGEDDVAGTTATHYLTKVDIEAAYEDADAVTDRDDFERFLDQLDDPVLEMEVWIDGDGRARRQRWHQPTPTTPGETTDAEITIEFTSFGEPVDIEIPDEDDVMDIDELTNTREF
jgi:hypothetical protein